MRGYERQILNSLSSGIMAVDRDGVIAAVNPAACAHFHVAGSVLRAGARLDELAVTRPLVEVLHDALREKKSVSRREFALRLEDGTTKEIGFSASPLEDSRGVVGVVFLFTDMTDRRDLERQAALNRQLASLGELTAGVVHELRSPVSVISGMAELLIRKLPQGDDRRKTAEAILGEAGGLERLISQFLALARPFDLELAHCAPEAVAARAFHLCLREAQQKGVLLASTCRPDVPDIRADADRLARALSNIVKNAIDAVSHGGHVSLDVRQDGSDVVFDITDDGPGIHLKPGEDLFRPFFTKKEGGTGLGLSIVHRIVTEHHGSVRYSNRDGGGARFEVRIPVDAWAKE